jgi:hypothetical protein
VAFFFFSAGKTQPRHAPLVYLMAASQGIEKRSATGEGSGDAFT